MPFVEISEKPRIHRGRARPSQPTNAATVACQHLLGLTGEKSDDQPIYGCEIHGQCTLLKIAVGLKFKDLACCVMCLDRMPLAQSQSRRRKAKSNHGCCGGGNSKPAGKPTHHNPQGPLPHTGTILLNFHHGLGDAVQLTAALAHLQSFRPNLIVDVQTKAGHVSCFAGLCRRAFVGGTESPDSSYDATFYVHWGEARDQVWTSHPSTKNELQLRVWGIEPSEPLCRYVVNPTQDAISRCEEFLAGVAEKSSDGRYNALLIHNSAASDRKRKTFLQTPLLCRRARQLGLVPILFDWKKDWEGLFLKNEAVRPPDNLWEGGSPADGGTVTALASLCQACIGVDSGPGHCFGASGTPTMIYWNRNHPLHFYGLNENVIHLVPPDHAATIHAAQEQRDAGLWYFHTHYRHVVSDNAYRAFADFLERVVNDPASLPQVATPAIDVTPGELPMVRSHGYWLRRDLLAQDLVIVRDVGTDDCYGLAGLATGGLQPSTILDIGAHVGVFSTLAHRRWPDASCVAVEANRRNMPALQKNVGGFARAIHAAATYESGELLLASTVFPGSRNSGGSTLIAGGISQKDIGDAYRLDAEPLERTTLEKICDEQGWERIDLIKLDCEGAELSILGNCDLDRVGVIVGEFHSKERWQELLARRFQDWVVSYPKGYDNHVFQLRRKV